MMKKERMNIEGKTFGKLHVIEYSHTNKHGQSMWMCRCECGEEKMVSGSHLLNGHTTSCGCIKKRAGDRLRKHGKRHTRLYTKWLGMKNRCFNANDRHFDCYGGRGITVCDEWKEDFEAFYDWAMANGYAENLTIDRINVDGNYEPSNCRWVTQKEQCINKRNTVYLEIGGVKKPLIEWAEILGVSRSTLYSRRRRGVKM